MTIRKAARRQREKNLRQREQRKQHADRRGAVAIAQRQQRRREPGARHRRMQADLREDQAKQARVHGALSSSPSMSGSSPWLCDSGRASTLRSASRICLARVSALSMVSEALETCSLMRATQSP